MTDQAQSPLDQLLSTLALHDSHAAAHIDESWMQGRTAYGGISSAVALAAAQAVHPTEAPLRYAQISFVGPVSGECRVDTRVLRQSKSSLFVEAGVSSDAGFGTNATFAFSPDRESHVDYNILAAPKVPAPQDLEPVPPHKVRPTFSQHFDMRPTGGPRFGWGEDKAEWLTWVRYTELPSCDPVVGLLAMGDALPPAAMALFRQFGPISSMNWTVNMLSAKPETEDGWWLLRNTASYARHGLSVQDMTIWNSAGEPIVSGSQAIAIYV